MTSTVSVVVNTTRRASPVQNAAVPTASPRGILTRAAYRSGGGTAGRSSARRSCRSSQWLVKFERERRRGARTDGVFLSQLHRPPKNGTAPTPDSHGAHHSTSQNLSPSLRGRNNAYRSV